MKLSAFDYAYPESLIAQAPLAARDASRLLVVQRASGDVHHAMMHDLPSLVRAGDLLVVNNSRVRAARVFGARAGGCRVEALLLHPLADHAHQWRALVKPARRLKIGDVISLSADLPTQSSELSQSEVVEKCGDASLHSSDTISATITALDNGAAVLEFSREVNVDAFLATYGHIPLPPYIKRPREALPHSHIDHKPAPATINDRERYQTIYAEHLGSAAAPTAGLHFTSALIAACRARGAHVADVTLHVGIDTFQPVRVDDLAQHHMHGEAYEIPAATVAAIEQTRKSGGRVIAVGTTTVRALESWAALQRASGETQLFITPGFRFQIVDALLTNFHQPKSTLLVLVSAFAGRERILAAYAEAIRTEYRLFSYGDAMLII